ncbi:MAG: thiamine biosynthesis protein ThiF [Acidobacteria bacterium RIFCSPLOWO2_12_FULL_60_22]|nr:MAG: thiamine biosynthesis protein ThiF [Acidobacteria bacterium RIFCSPLOWO2_12_FULL_60_22]
MDSGDHERYSRQILYRHIGEAGQEKLLASRAAIVGCGALGSFQAALLVRAGVGELRIIDRDYVEASNLQRQTLFDERDAAECLPKAVAAEAHLKQANSRVCVQGIVADLTAENAAELLSGVQVILDGTDNFETRYLINDFSVQQCIPWVYGAAVGSYGMTMTIVPGSGLCSDALAQEGLSSEASAQAGPCLACIFPEPPTGIHTTCDTEGIVGAAASAVASIQAAEALKLLVGDRQALHGKLISLDVWENRFQAVDPGQPAEGCRACRRREFVYLAGERAAPITLCGRNSVQIHERRRPVDFAELGRRLKPLGAVRSNPFVLQFSVASYEMTIFPDGRAIIKGTTDPGLARSLYARYIGA